VPKPTTHNPTANPRWRRILLLLLVLGAGADFFVRGPLRIVHGTEWNDFLSPYIQSRAWISGMDPYSTESFLKFWPAGKPMFAFVTKDAADGALVFKRGVPSPYPLTSFVVIAPLALMPWSVSQYVWIGLNLLATILVLCGLLAVSEVSWRDPRAWAFAAFALAVAPLHTGLFTENPIILVLGMGVAALCAAKFCRASLAALALAVAICLKPQVGLCFLLFFVVQRRCKVVTVASTSSAFMMLVAIARLTTAGTPWLPSYMAASRLVFARGAINDFTAANPIWFHMLNLQVVFYPLLGNQAATSICALFVGVALGVIWLFRAAGRNPGSDPFLTLSTLAVISLLPVYHRSYDAALLVIPIAWCILRASPRTATVRISLALSLLFLTPGGVLITQFAERAHLSAAIGNSWWWRSFVVGHQAWALLFLAVTLLSAMLKPLEPEQQETDQNEISESVHVLSTRPEPSFS
jgi:hypothetical protein